MQAWESVADRLVMHHGGHGRVSYVYVEEQSDRGRIMDFISALSGVGEVLSRESAASRYHLLAERMGDIVVGADRDTVFGSLAGHFEHLPSDYRNHGSHHEEAVPIIAWNPDSAFDWRDKIDYNFDLTRIVFFS